MKYETFLSVILIEPKFDKASINRMRALHVLLETNFHDFEILLIDRNEKSHNFDAVSSMLKTRSSFRYLKLAFSVSNDVAIYAGFENAIGDYVVIFEPNKNDLQLIPMLFAQEVNGKEIIIGAILKTTDSWVKVMVNRTLESFGLIRGIGMTNLMCLSRNAVNAVTKSGRLKDTLWNKLGKVGLNIYEIDCLKMDASAMNIKNGLKESYKRFVFNSLMPFRTVLAAMLLSAPMLVILFFMNFDLKILIWSALIILIMGSSFFMLIMIEFTNKLLSDKNESFDYLISFEKTSDVMVNRERLNVEMLS